MAQELIHSQLHEIMFCSDKFTPFTKVVDAPSNNKNYKIRKSNKQALQERLGLLLGDNSLIAFDKEIQAIETNEESASYRADDYKSGQNGNISLESAMFHQFLGCTSKSSVDDSSSVVEKQRLSDGESGNESTWENYTGDGRTSCPTGTQCTSGPTKDSPSTSSLLELLRIVVGDVRNSADGPGNTKKVYSNPQQQQQARVISSCESRIANSLAFHKNDRNQGPLNHTSHECNNITSTNIPENSLFVDTISINEANMALASRGRVRQALHQSSKVTEIVGNGRDCGTKRTTEAADLQFRQPRRSHSIAIQRNTSHYQKEYDEMNDEYSAENMYDLATWRMYNRIVDYRQHHPVRSDYYDSAASCGRQYHQRTRNSNHQHPTYHSGLSSHLEESEYDGEVFELEI